MKNKIEVQTLQDMLEQMKESEDKGIVFAHEKGDEKIYYSQLYKYATRFAEYLAKEVGMHAKDELIINTENVKEFLICFWGCILCGVIAVPVSHNISKEGIAKVCNVWKSLNSPRIVTSDRIIKVIEDDYKEEGQRIALTRINSQGYLKYANSKCTYKSKPEDIAYLQFSSGSTGSPKGIMLTHKNLITNIKGIIKGLNGIPEENGFSLSWLPLTHDMGLIGFHLSPLYCGIDQVIMMPVSFLKHPMLWMEKVCQYKCTIISSPNFGYDYFLKHYRQDNELDLQSIRVIFNGAEPIDYFLCEKFLDVLEEKGLHRNVIFPVYGMAEASLAISFPKVESDLQCICINRYKLNIGDKVEIYEDNGSQMNGVVFVRVGKAIEHCSLRICDDNNIELENNFVGNIQTKGENITAGYYNQENLTKETFTDNGWLKTGDIGFIYEESLVVVGRKKEILIINGKNYYPEDIEHLTAKYTNLHEQDIVSVEDDSCKESRMVIFVLFRGKIEVFSEVAYKIKKCIRVAYGCDVCVLPIWNIPKTTSGKVQRFELKNRFKSGEYEEIRMKVDSEIEDLKILLNQNTQKSTSEKFLCDIFEQEFPGAGIGIYDNFAEFGVSSLRLTNILSKIKLQYSEIEFDVSLMYKFQTIEKIAKYLDEGETYGKEQIPDINTILENL